MRRAILLGVVVCLSLTMTGCGGCGGMSQSYMRANAIRRPSTDNDDDDDDTPARQQPARKPKAPTNQKPAPRKPDNKKPKAPTKPEKPPATAQADKTDGGGAKTTSGGPVAVKPDKPLSLTERREMTLANMRKIAKAFEEYARVNGTYPPAADRRGVSWRVQLLPFLGYADLHREFHLDEPWESDHNLSLLAKIPAVYQSPERFDNKTNYLAPLGSATAFSSWRGLAPGRIEDGASNTIIMIEANDDQAVPWTKPDDFDTRKKKIEDQLGKLRSDGLFVVLGGGSVRLLPKSIEAKAIHTMLSADGGDNPNTAFSMTRRPQAEPDAVASAAGVVDPVAPRPVQPGPIQPGPIQPGPIQPGPIQPGPIRPGTVRPGPAGGVGPRTNNTVAMVRTAVPEPLELEKARARLSAIEAWKEKIANAKSHEQKRQVAKGLLGQVPNVEANQADLYILLQKVLDLAIEGRDAVTALEVVEQLIGRFEIDPTDKRVEVVSQLAKSNPAEAESNKVIMQYAVRLVSESLSNDDFDGADEMYQIAITAARRTNNLTLIRKLQESKREVDAARIAYQQVERVIETLSSEPDNEEANLAAGSYYCFIKGNWEKGLPMLSHGSDPRLRETAEKELDPPAVADLQIALADDWWSIGAEEGRTQVKRRMQLRAAHWYLKALPQLSGGLKRVKVEVRLKEAQRVYGKSALQQLMPAPASPTRARF